MKQRFLMKGWYLECLIDSVGLIKLFFAPKISPNFCFQFNSIQWADFFFITLNQKCRQNCQIRMRTMKIMLSIVQVVIYKEYQESSWFLFVASLLTEYWIDQTISFTSREHFNFIAIVSYLSNPCFKCNSAKSRDLNYNRLFLNESQHEKNIQSSIVW